ncbi:HalOD1 output domain-containing protein [Natrinema salaciae]|uniref:Halobacterial output domain-containing protein n=1 Tax=Natrinema salaciae TaxID=1186196 RepID=A0A1H9IL43_9EURY|nr:HalOD1 output domain-containing protein [Natrinema salaciae]SEQ75330.1 hypothetical protein SAMN04489841_2266 [Natrinema salaciae]
MHPTIAAVLERVAALEGRSPTALPPLYDTVDPEALASLLESDGDVTVCFEYDGYRIVIGPTPHEVEVIDGTR